MTGRFVRHFDNVKHGTSKSYCIWVVLGTGCQRVRNPAVGVLGKSMREAGSIRATLAITQQ